MLAFKCKVLYLQTNCKTTLQNKQKHGKTKEKNGNVSHASRGKASEKKQANHA